MAEEHFAALRPRRSNIITPEISLSLFRQYNKRGLHYHYQGEREGEEEREREFSGVMILLRRGRSAAKFSPLRLRLKQELLHTKKQILLFQYTVVIKYTRRNALTFFRSFSCGCLHFRHRLSICFTGTGHFGNWMDKQTKIFR